MLEDEVMSDPAQSEWLKLSLRAALTCDPIQVANDVELLASILRERALRASGGGQDERQREPLKLVLVIAD